MPGPLAALLPVVATAAIDLIKGPGAPDAPQVAGSEGGIDMQPEFAKTVADFLEKARKEKTGEGDVTKMNQQVVAADGNLPLAPLDAEKFGTGELLKPGGFSGASPEDAKPGFLAGMSTTEKMAMAAQIGSLLRGPGAPPPPSAPTGGQGINMQPVFQGVTLGQLGRR